MFVLQFLETIRNMLTEFANYQLILLKPFCVSAIRMFIYVQRFLFWSLSVSFIVFFFWKKISVLIDQILLISTVVSFEIFYV